MKIKSTNEPFNIEVKRFYVPITFSDNCPKCGKIDEVSYTSDQYFSYPIANEPFIHTQCFYCEDCDHEWDDECELTLTLGVTSSDKG